MLQKVKELLSPTVAPHFHRVPVVFTSTGTVQTWSHVVVPQVLRVFGDGGSFFGKYLYISLLGPAKWVLVRWMAVFYQTSQSVGIILKSTKRPLQFMEQLVAEFWSKDVLTFVFKNKVIINWPFIWINGVCVCLLLQQHSRSVWSHQLWIWTVFFHFTIFRREYEKRFELPHD